MDLIRRSQAGDERAFAALFEKYRNLVYKTAYLMLGDADEAEDVLQEVFIQVYKSLHTFQPAKAAFTTWLHRITVNRCLNRRRRRRPHLLSLDEVSPSSLASGSPSPESHLEEEDEIWQAVCRLSEKQRAVVTLRYYQELSYTEIAQVLGIPLGTVQSRLNRALKTLRKELERGAGDALPKIPLSQ